MAVLHVHFREPLQAIVSCRRLLRLERHERSHTKPIPHRIYMAYFGSSRSEVCHVKSIHFNLSHPMHLIIRGRIGISSTKKKLKLYLIFMLYFILYHHYLSLKNTLQATRIATLLTLFHFSQPISC